MSMFMMMPVDELIWCHVKHDYSVNHFSILVDNPVLVPVHCAKVTSHSFINDSFVDCIIHRTMDLNQTLSN